MLMNRVRVCVLVQLVAMWLSAWLAAAQSYVAAPWRFGRASGKRYAVGSSPAMNKIPTRAFAWKQELRS
jgi:hypothetical protein